MTSALAASIPPSVARASGMAFDRETAPIGCDLKRKRRLARRWETNVMSKLLPLLATLMLLAPLPVGAADDRPPPATLTLSADGMVTATPDTAIVSAGVVSEAETAGAALSENNAAMRKLVEAVRTAGVAEKDVQTSGFSIDPVMVYPQPKSDGTQDPPRITGYRVSNQVTVKIREIAKAGDLLDQVVRAGSNQIQGITFTVEDTTALFDQARGEAIRKARRTADVYADAGGFALGRILSVSEQGGYVPMPAPYARMAMAAEAVSDKVPVAVGEQEMRITVNVTWEIVQQP